MWSKVLESPSTESLLPSVHSVCDKKSNGGGSPCHIILYSQKKNHKVDTAQSTLKADNEQALRYVAGYVALVLKRKGRILKLRTRTHMYRLTSGF